MALSFSIAILVFEVSTRVGSAPIDRDMDAVPIVLLYTASSKTDVNVLVDIRFGVRLSSVSVFVIVVNFSGSNLIDNFTKET